MGVCHRKQIVNVRVQLPAVTVFCKPAELFNSSLEWLLLIQLTTIFAKHLWDTFENREKGAYFVLSFRYSMNNPYA